MIRLQVIGNLGKDCTVNNVNGKSVINFSVAHTEKFKDAQGNQKDKTVWVECAYWTDRTAVSPYLKKGTQVFAEGTPDVRTYTTSEGKQGASLRLNVFSVQLLGTKGSGGGEENSSYNDNRSAPAETGGVNNSSAEDDLPF